VISLAGRDILHSWGKFVFTGVGLGLLIGATLTMAGVYRGMVDDAQVLLDNSGADIWVVQKDTLGPVCRALQPARRRLPRILGMPGVARAANVTYLNMQVQQGDARRARDGGRLRAGRAGRAALPRRRAADHARPLRGRRRRAHRFRAGRAHPHPPPRLHGGGPDAAHGLLRRRSDGLHPAARRPGGAVPQGQRRHRERARAHRRQPALNRPGVPGLLEAIQASQTSPAAA
jgi:putative ABC transport system permease protein